MLVGMKAVNVSMYYAKLTLTTEPVKLQSVDH